MIWNGWVLAEETSEFIRFENGNCDSKISLRLTMPLSRPIQARFWHEGLDDYSAEFESLPDLAKLACKPDSLRAWFNKKAPHEHDDH